MKSTLFSYLTVFFILLSVFIKAQKKNEPFEIKLKTDYVQQKTKVLFPKTLMGFERKRLISYDQNYTNIGSVYELKIGKKITTISVYVYPAETSTENLRDQFLSFNVVVNRNAHNEDVLKPQFVKLTSEKAIVNGIKTVFDYNLIVPDFMKGQKEQINKSLFSVYDCGQWNIKFRITSESYDEARLEQVEKLLVENFNPLKIAQENPINISSKPRILISKTAQRDSLMLKSTIVEAEAKVDWLANNESAAELSTGFSDFNINSHEFAIGEKLKFYNDNKANIEGNSETIQYFNGLQKIFDEGYLKDFIYAQTFGVVDYPEGVKRSEEYKIFLVKNNISEEIRELMYKIYD